MTGESDLGNLPRFARNVTILAGGVSRPHGTSIPVDHCIVRPFSGVLDVQVGRGRVPTLDLSYLTLAPLVARSFDRSTHRKGRPGSADAPPEDRAADPRAGDGNDEGDLRVRDVIHREEGQERVPPDRSVSLSGEPGQPRTRLGLDLDHPQFVSQSSDPETPDRPDSTTDPTTHTMVDRSRPAEPSARPESGESGDPAERSATRDTARELRREPESTAPDRTVIDRSSPSFDVGAGIGESTTPLPPLGQARTPETAGIDPPRMVAQRESAADRSGERTAPPHPGETGDGPPPGVSTPSASGNASPSTVPGTDTTTAGDSSGDFAAEVRPRMTVHRRQATNDGTATAGENASGGPSPSAGTEPRDRPGQQETSTDRRDARIESIVAASTDPESRLVDRLYRALQEREAIERRRRGGR